jgi:hypothetical protein
LQARGLFTVKYLDTDLSSTSEDCANSHISVFSRSYFIEILPQMALFSLHETVYSPDSQCYSRPPCNILFFLIKKAPTKWPEDGMKYAFIKTDDKDRLFVM